jgi:hypothetical protein
MAPKGMSMPNLIKISQPVQKLKGHTDNMINKPTFFPKERKVG